MRVAAASCILAALVIGWAGRAQAQPSDQKAVAEHLFEEGRARLVDKDYAAACLKLAESQRLDPSIGTALYLAACYEKMGKTASAWALFREAEELAARGGDSKRAAIARARAEALAPKLSKLTIVVPESARVEGLTVTRDAAAVSASIWGAGVPIDPGAHVIEVKAPGKVAFSTSIDVTGASTELVIPPLEDAPRAEPPKPEPVTRPPEPVTQPREPQKAPAPPAPAVSTWGGQRTLGLTLGSVGVAGLLAGVVFTLRTSALVDDASAKGCDTSASPVRCPDNPDGRAGLASMDDARKTWRPMSIAAFAAGGALTAVGGWLFFTAPSTSTSRALVVTPSLGAGGGGLLVEGSL